MEKILNAMPTDEKIKAEKVLEINASHPVLGALKAAFESDEEKAKKFTELLYNQALLIEGLSIEDPVAFSNMICDLIAEK
jgi:molecular chaperone HtpG